MFSRNILIIFVFVSLFSTVLFSSSVMACQNINASGSYQLTTNIGGGSSCININVSHVSLDLGGYTIANTSANGINITETGLDAFIQNVTIFNGTIQNSSTSISIVRLENSTIENLTITNASANGITVNSNIQNLTLRNIFINQTNTIGFSNSGSNITAINITSNNNTGIGIQSSSGSLNSFSNITTNNNFGDGFSLTSSSSNLTNLTSYNNDVGLVVSSGSNVNTNIYQSLNLSNNAEYGLLLETTSGGVTFTSMNFSGGSVYLNSLGGIGIITGSPGGSPEYNIYGLRFENFNVYSNNGSNLNVSGSENMTFSNITFSYSGTIPSNWVSGIFNLSRNMTLSGVAFHTVTPVLNFSNSNATITNSLFNSSTKNANVSIVRNSGTNYYVSVQNETPASAPFGSTLGYYFNISNQSALNVNITFYYTNSDVSGLDESQMRMYKYNGSSWTNLADVSGVTVSLDTNVNSITASNISSFSTFAIFAPTPSSTPPSSDDAPARKDLEMDYELLCEQIPGLQVHVTDSDEEQVSGVQVGIYNPLNPSAPALVSSNTGSNGFVLLDLSSLVEGSTYKIKGYKSGYYNDPPDQEFVYSCTSGELNIDYSTECPDGTLLVTITDHDENPVEGASVYISGVGDQITDSNGKVSFNDLFAYRSYNAYAGKEGYTPKSMDVLVDQCLGEPSVSFEPNCPNGFTTIVTDSFSGPVYNAYLNVDGGETVFTDETGRASFNVEQGSHSVSVYISGYPDNLGQIETNYEFSCQGQPDGGTEPPDDTGTRSCSSNNDCGKNKYCDDKGVCRGIDECKDYGLSVPEESNVGDTVNITVTKCGVPLAETTIIITNPQNEEITVKTDAKGVAAVNAEFEGIYKVSTQGEISQFKSFRATAVSDDTDRKSKRGIFGGSEESDNLILLGTIFVLIIGALIYFRQKGSSAKYKPYKK